MEDHVIPTPHPLEVGVCPGDDVQFSYVKHNFTTLFQFLTLRFPILKVSNFTALSPTEAISLVWKDLNSFEKYTTISTALWGKMPDLQKQKIENLSIFLA